MSVANHGGMSGFLALYGESPYTRLMSKSSRLEVRLTSEQKLEIERAAALSGRTVSEFSVGVLVREAEEIIDADRQLRLSKQSWVEFNDILDRPARPVSGLADLLSRPSVFSE